MPLHLLIPSPPGVFRSAILATMTLTPILTDARTRRVQIRQKALEGIKAAFPLSVRDYTIELEDVRVLEKEFGPAEQKQALLEGASLTESIKGTLVLKKDGKEVERVRNYTLMHLPYFTERHTFVVDGNEYQVSNQIRMKPGVYTRRRANEELEAAFNLAKGTNFRLSLDPEHGHPYMEYGTTQIPLYPILRKLGVPHQDIAQAWGSGVAAHNQTAFEGKHDRHFDKLYNKLVHPSRQNHPTPEARVDAVRQAYEATVMDGEVNQATLGKAHDKVTPVSLLDASRKLLDIYKSNAVVDDRDSLAFKTFHGVEDFIKERIGLDARGVAMKVKGRAAHKTSLRELLPSAPFTTGIRSFLTSSQLSSIPTQINPMELIDHAVKVTPLGEGGITSDRAIPMEARELHPTHFGILDPVRTPEHFSAGVDIRTTQLAHRDEKGNLYTPVKNVKTGKPEFLSARAIYDSVIAFPGQPLTGMVAAMHKGKVQHVPAAQVQYELHHVSQVYSPASNLIPLMESNQGNRSTMGAKMQTQALPLVEREVPLVQVGYRDAYGKTSDKLRSYEQAFGKLVVPTAPVAGKVVKIDHQYIYIKPSREKKAAYDTTEAPRYKKVQDRKPEDCASAEVLNRLGRKAVGKLGPYMVFVVDGKAVRDILDLEFHGGANPSRHGYVPENELWVEGSPQEYAHIALDEFIECRAMVAGASYDEAHAQGKAAERLFRSAHPAATLYDVQSWLGNLTQEVCCAIEKEAAEALAGRTKRADHVFKVMKFRDLTIHIDRFKGFEKRFNDPKDGLQIVKYQYDYGFIPGIFDSDGEELDVYVGPDEKQDTVYVIKKHFRDANGNLGKFDEHKCFVGMTRQQALNAFDYHIHPKCRGEVLAVPYDEFKKRLKQGTLKTASEKDDGLVKVPYETNFPFAAKTCLHQTLKVKVGDEVKAGQALGESNFTRDGTLALGKNLRVAYMPYYGLNSNDAVVISESCAQKLTSEHMYKEILSVEPDMTLGRELHRVHFGAKYTSEQYRKLDEAGVIKKGQQVLPHDPLIVGVLKTKLSATDAILGNLKKTLVSPYREVVRAWEHESPGEVVDVFQSGKRVVVTVRTYEPMRIGDKLSGRYGNKGVVAHIVPDHQMVQDEKGQPIELLLTSAGVISRINPAQVIETAVTKVADKTGKPLVLENFTGRDNVKWAKALLKEHGLKDKETVFDPISGKKIPNVLVGKQFTLRLFKTTDSNYSARGTGSYDVNQQPTKGGSEGAKGMGQMEFNALVAHNARNVLRETSLIKSQRNDEFWRAVQLGLPLPPLKSAFAYDKFTHMLQASGVRVDKQGHQLTLKPMTDRDVLKLSGGAIANDKLVRAKDLAPEKGGFFDPVTTGGTTGTRWSHIELAEPVVNPVFFDPARRLLGMTNKDFESLHFQKGGKHIRAELNRIDVAARIRELRRDIKTLSGSKLDDAVKQLKYLEALKKTDLKPGDAYVLSKLPVLPPVMRPIMPGMGGSQMVVGDANYLYQNAMLHNQLLTKQNENPVLPPEEHANLRKNLFTAVGAVIGTHETDNAKLQKRGVKGFLEHLTGKTTPKSSFFQQKIMKRQLDSSGRGTIAPDGSLGMDEVGVPEEMLWEMFGKFIIARLVRQGFSALAAKEMLEKKHPSARSALLAECKERPVMVNRAPTLYRYNMVGAYAVPVAGKTIRVNPFIEKGMNADYDGDTFQVHAPVLRPAVEEVKKMTLSNLLFNDEQKDDLMVFPRMEAVLGLHVATSRVADGKVHKFKTKGDALAAYKRGELSLHDKVEIG